MTKVSELTLAHTAPRTVDNSDVAPRHTPDGDGFRQTLLVTPCDGNQGAGLPTPLRIHHPFDPSPIGASPLVIRRRQRAARGDQGEHLELTIGPESMRAEMHGARTDGAGVEGAVADRRLDLDEHPALGGNVTVLKFDPAVVLLCGIIVVLPLFLWWLSKR